MASASIDFDSPTTPGHPGILWLARAVGYTALVALGMALWGRVASEAWRADEAVENDGDFGPSAVVANDVNYGWQVARGRLQPAPGALADSPARPSPEGARENTNDRRQALSTLTRAHADSSP